MQINKFLESCISRTRKTINELKRRPVNLLDIHQAYLDSIVRDTVERNDPNRLLELVNKALESRK